MKSFLQLEHCPVPFVSCNLMGRVDSPVLCVAQIPLAGACLSRWRGIISTAGCTINDCRGSSYRCAFELIKQKLRLASLTRNNPQSLVA
jgi:hypothetical protein